MVRTPAEFERLQQVLEGFPLLISVRSLGLSIDTSVNAVGKALSAREHDPQ